jgi:hypothetical protein
MLAASGSGGQLVRDGCTTAKAGDRRPSPVVRCQSDGGARKAA